MLPDPHFWHNLQAVILHYQLSGPLILEGYRKGLFPWGSPTSREWWCPDPRGILYLDDFHVSRSLKKRIRQKRFKITLDHDFSSTIRGCSLNRQDSWLDPELIQAMIELSQLGHAHSVEAWVDGNLVGGVYGTEVGNMFIADSMFSRQTDASKVALYHLVDHLKTCGFELIDCQVTNAHTVSLGAREISREFFLSKLEESMSQHSQSLWYRN